MCSVDYNRRAVSKEILKIQIFVTRRLCMKSGAVEMRCDHVCVHLCICLSCVLCLELLHTSTNFLETLDVLLLCLEDVPIVLDFDSIIFDVVSTLFDVELPYEMLFIGMFLKQRT